MIYRGKPDWSTKTILNSEKICGYSREEFSTQKVNYLDIIHPDDKQRVFEEGSKLPEKPMTIVQEYRIIDKDGNIRWVSDQKSSFHTEDGSFTGVDGIVYEITDRKIAEEALWESEEGYRTVLEANPDPVVVYDSEGKVLYLNPAFTRVFGWTSEERLGKKMDVFVPDEAWPETKMMIEKVLAGETFSGIETHRYTKEKELIPVRISGASYRDFEGNHVGTVVNLRDISEQKRLETKLQQAQKLEAIGILAGGLAHDFNNLLGIILGNLELAKEGVKPEDRVSENLTEVEEASFRIRDLTKKLITFSEGGLPVKRIGSIAGLVKDTATELNATCEFSFPEDLWPAEFDPGQMKHAIKNLIDNAIESMPEGGSIKVQAENFEIDSATKEPGLPLSEGKYTKLSIRDFGIGIPEEHFSKIFDPYFSTKEMGVEKGMGLSLATTYSIIKRHKGHIIVESEPGVGSTFALYLPAHD